MSEIERSSSPKLVADLWPETGEALGLSRNATYEAARRGQIPTVPFGKLKKVPMWFHRQLLEGAGATQQTTEVS